MGRRGILCEAITSTRNCSIIIQIISVNQDKEWAIDKKKMSSIYSHYHRCGQITNNLYEIERLSKTMQAAIEPPSIVAISGELWHILDSHNIDTTRNYPTHPHTTRWNGQIDMEQLAGRESENGLSRGARTRYEISGWHSQKRLV